MEKTVGTLAVRRFLNRGNSKNLPIESLTQACEKYILEISRTSLKKALPLARKFAEVSAKDNRACRLTALRILARTAHLSGLFKEALAAYLEIKELSRRQPLTAARVDRALIDIYMYLGDYKKATRAAKSAIAIFTRHRHSDDVVQTEVNYANLLHRQDRHREAERLYHKAEKYFGKGKNPYAEARACYNRANTLVQLFDFGTASELYHRSFEIYNAEGLALDANDSRYGLAWMHMLRGDFHTAFMELGECERVYRDGGDPRGEELCVLDRAEMLLNLALYEDALEASRLAEKRMKKLNMGYERAKASLFRGQAAAALGMRREAMQSLRQASEEFRAAKNDGFLGVSHLMMAHSGGEQSGVRQEELIRARRLFSKAQLPLWEAICDLTQVTGKKNISTELKRLKENKAVREVPHLYALWQVVLGDLAYRDGKANTAGKHWERAADRLDAVRAAIPPTELRIAYGRSVQSPHLRLVQLEVDRNPSAAAIWSEKYKTSGIWRPLLSSSVVAKKRKRAEESLSSLAAQVAAISRQIDGFGGVRISGGASTGCLSAIKRRVRDSIIEVENEFKGSRQTNDYLGGLIRKISKDLPILQFHLQGNDILLFRHDRGNTEVVNYRDGVSKIDSTLRKWRFILESRLLAERYDFSPNLREEEAIWDELGDWLWGQLGAEAGWKKVLVIPEGPLANIPWPALRFRGQALGERYRFIESPSLRHYRHALDTKVKSEAVEIFAGVGESLNLEESEIPFLKKRFDGRVILHDRCTRGDWPVTGEAAIWHYFGHAELRADNPFYSCLHLNDGPLFAADFRLKDCRVNLVTLAACQTGMQISVPERESTGLVRALLEMGVRNVVAGRWTISDKATALWMKTFYGRLLNGTGLLDSFKEASDIIYKQYHSAYYWAAFSLWGAGDMGGFHEPEKRHE